MQTVARRFCRLSLIAALAVSAPAGFAQDAAPASEVKSMCPAVIATLMMGKTSCTAGLCNTGASEGGFTGFLTKMVNRGVVDGPSFSAGVGAQLATALKKTGCFEVLDAATLEETRKELEAMGRKAPPSAEVDFLVRVSVTKLEYVLDESGIFGFKTVTAKSSMTLDSKVISAAAGSLVDAATFDAAVERKSSGVDLGIYKSNNDAATRGNPFAEVSRDAVNKAAMGLATKILAQPPQPKAAGAPAASEKAPGPAAPAAPSSPPASAPQ
jgi:curli biogenesis system outer membrane secretion channel CsgG